MISVLVMTKNEEANIGRCLECLQWSKDIVVLDDHSTDRTVDVARAAGARVVIHSAGSENEQRTYSLRKIGFRYPWVYNPDADEVTPGDLRDEMLRVVGNRSRPEVAFRMRFKNMFMGRWIRRSSLYPTWVMRLFKPDRISFERTTNLRYIVAGEEGKLQSHFLHYSFDKGLQAWFQKHAVYARHEAWETVRDLDGGQVDWLGLLTLSDSVRRRAALKQLSFRVPFRPTMRFFFTYLLRGGFLDGMPGYQFCRLMAVYETMIDVQVRELLAAHKSGEQQVVLPQGTGDSEALCPDVRAA